MQNEKPRVPRKKIMTKPKQKTQPKPLNALRDEVRAEKVTEHESAAFDANAVFAKYKPLAGAASKKMPEAVARILSALELGLSYKKAAVLAGVHFDTLNEWRKADSVFSDQCRRARINLEERMLAKLSAHTDEDLKAVTYTLERICSPEKYSKRFKPLEMVVKAEIDSALGKVYRVVFDPGTIPNTASEEPNEENGLA
jgi:hypothetical protein